MWFSGNWGHDVGYGFGFAAAHARGSSGIASQRLDGWVYGVYDSKQLRRIVFCRKDPCRAKPKKTKKQKKIDSYQTPKPKKQKKTKTTQGGGQLGSWVCFFCFFGFWFWGLGRWVCVFFVFVWFWGLVLVYSFCFFGLSRHGLSLFSRYGLSRLFEQTWVAIIQQIWFEQIVFLMIFSIIANPPLLLKASYHWSWGGYHVYIYIILYIYIYIKYNII